METTPTSSVLLFNPPRTNEYAFGADSFHHIDEFDSISRRLGSYSVVVYFDQNQSPTTIKAELNHIKKSLSKANVLLISPKKEGSFLVQLKNENLINAVLYSDAEPKLSLQIQELLAEYAESEQNELVLSLYLEQNRKLEKLNLELEERVEKRQKYLLKAQKNLKSHQEKISLLHEGVLSIFRGESISHIESFLFDVLKEPLDLEWLRIRFSEQSLLSSHGLREVEPLKSTHLELPLRIGRPNAGQLLLKKKNKSFTDDEMELLTQLSETLSLAIGKIINRQDAENLKQQWESTFDAIAAPLCLTDAKLNILRTNRSFNEETQLPHNKILGQPALPLMLGPDAKILEERLLSSKSGKIEATATNRPEEKYYEVSLHKISPRPADTEAVFMILFKDITDQRKMEIQLLETSKMAELGIIGSSIAHELNNPIAGMTSFLQLIKMDLQPDDDCWEDISEMELAAKRCKEIIENLLGFARKQESQGEHVDLYEVVFQAVQISELQTRSKGLTVELPQKVNGIFINGNFNQLTQAVQNLLKNALEACMEKMEKDSAYRAKIDCKITKKNDVVSIAISDNGPGIPKEIQSKIFNPLFTTKDPGLAAGLGLTVAFKIIAEHNGQLEISSRLGRGTTARISFLTSSSSPDLKS